MTEELGTTEASAALSQEELEARSYLERYKVFGADGVIAEQINKEGDVLASDEIAGSVEGDPHRTIVEAQDGSQFYVQNGRMYDMAATADDEDGLMQGRKLGGDEGMLEDIPIWGEWHPYGDDRTVVVKHVWLTRDMPADEVPPHNHFDDVESPFSIIHKAAEEAAGTQKETLASQPSLFEAAAGEDTSLQDEEIQDIMKGEFSFGRLKVRDLGKALERVQADDSDKDFIGSPEKVQSFQKELLDIVTGKIRFYPSAELDKKQKAMLDESYVDFKDAQERSLNRVGSFVTQTLAGNKAKGFPMKSFEFKEFTLDTVNGEKDLLADEVNSIKSNITVERKVPGTYVTYSSDARMQERLAGETGDDDKIIVLNPQSEHTVGFFKELIEKAEASGISMQASVFNRAQEAADTAKNLTRTVVVQTQGIVIRVGKDADKMLDIAADMYTENQDAFTERITGRLPLDVADGFGLAEMPPPTAEDPSPRFLKSRVDMLDAVKQQVEAQGVAEDDKVETYRALLQAEAAKRGLSTDNLAFNADTAAREPEPDPKAEPATPGNGGGAGAGAAEAAKRVEESTPVDITFYDLSAPLPADVPLPRMMNGNPDTARDVVRLARDPLNTAGMSPDRVKEAELEAKKVMLMDVSRHRYIINDANGVPHWAAELPNAFSFDGGVRGEYEDFDPNNKTGGQQIASIFGDPQGKFTDVILETDQGEAYVISRTSDKDEMSAAKQTFSLRRLFYENGAGFISSGSVDSNELKGVIAVPGQPLVLNSAYSGRDDMEARSSGNVTRIVGLTLGKGEGIVASNHPMLNDPKRNIQLDTRIARSLNVQPRT